MMNEKEQNTYFDFTEIFICVTVEYAHRKRYHVRRFAA